MLRSRHLLSENPVIAEEKITPVGKPKPTIEKEILEIALPAKPKQQNRPEIVLDSDSIPFLNEGSVEYKDLPSSQPFQRNSLPLIYHTTKTMAGCLFIMDDTIRLLEWLAYHYTVLPLSHLMVAIDPNSQQTDRIIEILVAWDDKIEIKAYRNDSEWLDLPDDYGYSRNVRNAKTGKYMKWFQEKKSNIYFQQVHKRRQNYFCVHCMRYMKQKGMDWTIMTDSDEYIMFNYIHEKEENRSLYDTIRRGVTADDIDKERQIFEPYRKRLPSMMLKATIADFLQQEKPRLKCVKFPGLQFTSYESERQIVYKNVPEGVDVNPYHLVTLRHRKAGNRQGVFSKTMVDVSHGTFDDYSMESNFNIHNPNKLLCGLNGHSGSSQDYISAIFRLHHYRTGTWESFIERGQDRRANMTVSRFTERNIEPQLVDDDIRPWIAWFIEKVGQEEAKRLLFHPLSKAYALYQQTTS